MTNPSFPEYVKIRYADDIEKRLKELNRSECTPFAFRLYAYYEVSQRLTDLKIHEMIDTLNPKLRSIDNVNGKKRVREFYAMSKEDAYAMFDAIAQINGLQKNLHLAEMSDVEKEEEKVADEIKTRMSSFDFQKIGIPVGSVLHYVNDESITCTVVDNRKVRYGDEITSLSALTKRLKGGSGQYNGAYFFTYNGKTVKEIRRRTES